MTSIKNSRSRIPYLDGLRAYSILVVVFAHTLIWHNWLGNSWFLDGILANGQLGVRIFFVLSGFLITTLLLQEHEADGRISIRSFYERRIARIFPAFYLYIAVIFIGAATHVFQNVDKSALFAASTFTWNFIHFWRHGAAPSGDAGLLGHFWTLSLEEQFYLFWPGCLVLLGKLWSRRVAMLGIVLFPALRLSAFLFLHPSHLRTAIMERFVQDEIFWGVLLAFAIQGGLIERFSSHKLRIVAPWLSGILLFVLCPLMERNGSNGLGAYLVPTLQGISTVLLIVWLLSGSGGILRNSLESWPAIQLGLLSYSLYLWQQIATQWSGTRNLWIPVQFLLALAAAILCYRLWELPLRKRIRQWFHQARLQQT